MRITRSPFNTRAVCAMIPGLCSVGWRLTRRTSPVRRWRHTRLHAVGTPPLLVPAPRLGERPAGVAGVAGVPATAEDARAFLEFGVAPAAPPAAASGVGAALSSAPNSSRFASAARWACERRERSMSSPVGS